MLAWIPPTFAAAKEYSLDAGTAWTSGIGASFELAANKTYAINDIQVRQYDAAGNVSPAQGNAAVIQTLEPIAPPTFALHADTGSSNSDNVTKDATVDVQILPAATQWSYSVDGGSNWTHVTDTNVTSFELAADATYAAGAIQVVQRGADGTDSSPTVSTAAITTDNTPLVAPSAIALQLDSGASSSDGITNDATVNVTLGSDAQLAGWEYSTDGGVNWVTGVGASFELANNTTYAANKIQARLLDKAGNEGAVAKISSQVVTDMVGNTAVVTNIGNSNTIDLDFLYALKTSGEDVLASGTAEVGASVKVSLSADLHHTVTATDGTWSVNASSFHPSVNTDNEITFGSGSSALTLADNSTNTMSVEITDLAGNVSSVATKTYTVDTPGLKISESNNVVTVSGTATGKLEVSVDASGVATFARYNASGEKFTATTTVSDFYDKQLKGVTQGDPSS